MNKYKTKIKRKIDDKLKSDLLWEDKFSCTEFKKQLDKGKTYIGSCLFTGKEREVKLIKQICSYLGYKYVKQEKVVCCLLDSSSKLNVVHYTVEMINE